MTITVTALPTSFGCATRGAVSDASNTGLVSDCEALLDARDVLVGLGSPLNWSASTPIAQWDGVTVDETLMRVTTLDLRKMRLKGMISSDLSRVTALKGALSPGQPSDRTDSVRIGQHDGAHSPVRGQ